MPVDNVPIDRTGAACPRIVAWCPQRRGRRARRGGRARAPLSARRAPALPVVPGKMRYSAWTGATRIAVSSPRPPSVGPCARPKGDHRARARHTLFETVALPHLKVDGDVHAASPSARGVHGFVVAQERQVDKPAAALSFTADGIHDGLTVRRTVVLTVAQRGDREGRPILRRRRRAATSARRARGRFGKPGDGTQPLVPPEQAFNQVRRGMVVEIEAQIPDVERARRVHDRRGRPEEHRRGPR